ncbi:uncharacterized protein LOC144689991 [Cetorhinus maximus]
MPRNRSHSLVRRIFCCGCQGFWRKRVASATLRLQRQLRRLAGGSQDELGVPCQEDTASLHLSQEPTAAGCGRQCRSKGHTADGKRCVRSSSSSVSTVRRLKQKRKLTPLSSLPLQKYVNKSYAYSNSDEAERYSGISPEELLTPPVINLIPPTPSNVIDDEQFFEINLEDDNANDNECAGGSGRPKAGDAGSCRSDQDTVRRRTCGTNGNHVSCVKGDAPVMPFSTSVKSDIYMLKDITDVNSDNAPFQHGTKPDWKLEGRIGSEAESNTLSQIDLFQNCEETQLPQDSEQNHLSNKEEISKELMTAKLRLSPLHTELSSVLQFKRPATRTCSLDGLKTMTGDLQSLGLAPETVTDGDDSPRQRCTVASYIPLSAEQNRNIKEAVDTEEPRDKSLEEMNTDEVCEWFRNLKLEKSIPSIKEAKLQGHQLVSIDLDTLDRLQLTTAEEREILLSSIYKELHPLDTASQTFDKLLDTIGPHDIERFTAALVTLSDSQSSDWVGHQSKFSHKREDKPLENKKLKKSPMVNLSVKAFQQNLQLKVPRDSTVTKVIDACRNILGLQEDSSHLSLNIVTSRTEIKELQAEKQIGELKVLEKKELKLQLCKKVSDNLQRLENQAQSDLRNASSHTAQVPESVLAPVTLHAHPQIGLQDYQTELRAKENEIRELKQLIKNLKANHQQVLELQKCFHSLHQEAVDLLVESACPPNPQEDSCNSEAKLTRKEMLIQHLTLAHKELDNESCIDKGVLEHMKMDYQTLKERVLTFYQKQQQAQWRDLQEFQRTKYVVTEGRLKVPHVTALKTHPM